MDLTRFNNDINSNINEFHDINVLSKLMQCNKEYNKNTIKYVKKIYDVVYYPDIFKDRYTHETGVFHMGLLGFQGTWTLLTKIAEYTGNDLNEKLVRERLHYYANKLKPIYSRETYDPLLF